MLPAVHIPLPCTLDWIRDDERTSAPHGSLPRIFSSFVLATIRIDTSGPPVIPASSDLLPPSSFLLPPDSCPAKQTESMAGTYAGDAPRRKNQKGQAQSAQVWRNMNDGKWGTRGEWWAVVQLIPFALVLYPPPSLLPAFLPASFCASPSPNAASLGLLSFDAIRVTGVLLAISSCVFFVSALKDLGESLTPFPKPAAAATLQTGGLYSIVRHPIYAGAIFFGAGLTLATCSSDRLVYTVLLAMFLDRKASVEEVWLKEKFGQPYVGYSSRVKKLIPLVY
ncbi:hypothetical protein CLOP_g9834 [Closterium sp. NIES-67]|nr:hypothetical protein CLOP_g9834 [Closterium sp. NIES-67]